MSKYIYMAGLIDGEGTIGISIGGNGNKYRWPYVSVTSTTKEIIDWLTENFGGTVVNQKVYQDHHKQSWSWRLRKQGEIRTLLEGILPYMLEPEKIRRAHMILNEYPLVTNRNGKYTEKEIAAKLDFEQRFLNHIV